jgi:hypothetical protein
MLAHGCAPIGLLYCLRKYRVEISTRVEIPTLALRERSSGLTVTRESSADVTVTVVVENDRDSFASSTD